MPYLVQKSLDGSVANRWELGQLDLVVGRGDRAHARTVDKEMSRQHFKISCREQKYFIQDLQSRNGTLVNGQRITEVALNLNDRITAGETTFQFTDGDFTEPMPTIMGVHRPKLLKKT